MADDHGLQHAIEDIVKRLGVVETNEASMSTAITALAEQVGKLASNTEAKFEQLSNKIDASADRSRITWPLIFTCVTTITGVVAIFGVIGSMALTPIRDELRESHGDQKEANMLHADHVMTEGHTGMKIRVTALESEVRSIQDSLTRSYALLDESLQREMRLLDDNTMARITALDDRLQAEMRLLNQAQDERMSAHLQEAQKVAERVDIIRDDMAKVGSPADPIYFLFKGLDDRVRVIEKGMITAGGGLE